MKIATISLDIIWQNADANLARMTDFIIQAKADQCDTVVLPEVCTSGFLSDINLIEPPQGISYQTLQALAKDQQINIIAGLSEKGTNTKAKNIAVAFDKQGQEQTHFTKLHPFSFANEGDTFQAGDSTVIFNIDNVPCSVFICYDLRFPEVFRSVAKEVEMIFVIANWPHTRKKHWVQLLQARAIENQCFVVGVNRTGQDGVHLKYHGDTMVINPLGKVLLQTDAEYKTCECDTSEVARIRSKFPFLEDIHFL